MFNFFIIFNFLRKLNFVYKRNSNGYVLCLAFTFDGPSSGSGFSTTFLLATRIIEPTSSTTLIASFLNSYQPRNFLFFRFISNSYPFQISNKFFLFRSFYEALLRLMFHVFNAIKKYYSIFLFTKICFFTTTISNKFQVTVINFSQIIHLFCSVFCCKYY